MRCWICYDEISIYFLFPEKEDYFMFPLDQNTFELKFIDKFIFLYYRICETCLNAYLDTYPINFRNRELGLK